MKARKEIAILIGITLLGALEGIVIGAIVGQLPINFGIRLTIIIGLSGLVGCITGHTLGRICLPLRRKT